ncbi:MAG: DnaA N-terminal domain-containing protein, partial [Pseudomonadota bacterium]
MSEIILDKATSDIIIEILHDSLEDPVSAIKSAGIDTSYFFEFGDWRGMDFSMSDLSGISFRGALMNNAKVQFRFAAEIMDSRPKTLPEFITEGLANAGSAIGRTRPEGGASGTEREKRTEATESGVGFTAPRTELDPSLLDADDAERAKHALAVSLGNNIYQTWIDPIDDMIIEDGVLRGTAPTAFIAKYVSQNFGDQIISVLASLGHRISRISISANQTPQHKSLTEKLQDRKKHEV